MTLGCSGLEHFLWWHHTAPHPLTYIPTIGGHQEEQSSSLCGHGWPHRCVIWATWSRQWHWQLLLYAERCGISRGGAGPFSSTKWLSSTVITWRSSRDVRGLHVPSLIPEVRRRPLGFSGSLYCCQSGFASCCRWRRSFPLSRLSFFDYFFFLFCHLVDFAFGAAPPPPPAPGPNHGLHCFMTLTAGWPCALPQVGSRQAAWRLQITGIFVLHSKSCCPVTAWNPRWHLTTSLCSQGTKKIISAKIKFDHSPLQNSEHRWAEGFVMGEAASKFDKIALRQQSHSSPQNLYFTLLP